MMLRTSWRAALALLATAALAMAAAVPMPGTLNYVEGQASVDGQALKPESAGSEQLSPNQVLSTSQGNAEVLLMPGVFLRIGNDSAVRAQSLGLAATSVTVERGSAMFEVDQWHKENRLNVVVNGTTTRIEDRGLYDFQASPPVVRVLDGKAQVQESAKQVTLKKEHEVALAETKPTKAQKFDLDALKEDPLYRWSALRSDYESQANLDAARTIVVNGGWYGPGWYWDPYWDAYAFLPGYGVLYSPFGWGFYSPFWLGNGYYGRPFGGFWYHGGIHRGFVGPHHGFGGPGRFHENMPHVGAFHGGFGGGGFHGGGRRG